MDIQKCIDSSNPKVIVTCLGRILDHSYENNNVDIMVDINRKFYSKFQKNQQVIDNLIQYLSKPINSRDELNAASYLCCILDSYLNQRDNLIHPDLVCQYFNTAFINKGGPSQLNKKFPISTEQIEKIFDSMTFDLIFDDAK